MDNETIIEKLNLCLGDENTISIELQNHEGNIKFLNSFSKSNKNIISGLFDCSYHPYLKIEYAEIKNINPSIEIENKFENIHPVIKLDATQGLKNDQVVAIFPENFKSINPEVDQPVFYFVDIFTKRHLIYTRKKIAESKNATFLIFINDLDENQIMKLVANWVNLHEKSHRTGELPLPNFIFEKSNRFSAALEELRADLISIEECFKKSKNKQDEYYLTAGYIIAERLISYPLFREKFNFDTISSIIFWNELQKLTNGIINIETIKSSIYSIIHKIDCLEKNIKSIEDKNLRKLRLVDEIKLGLSDYNDLFNKYVTFWQE
jgi:hypothetical protein